MPPAPQPQKNENTNVITIQTQAPQAPPQPQIHQHAVIATRLIYTESHVPMIMKCYNCNNDGLTRVEMIDGAATWGTCVICCLLFGIFAGFGACAFCIDGIKDVHHFCPHCNTLLGVRKPCH